MNQKKKKKTSHYKTRDFPESLEILGEKISMGSTERSKNDGITGHAYHRQTSSKRDGAT